MIEAIDLSELKKWKKIVKEFPNYDVYYLPEYAKSFEIHGDGEPLLIYYNYNDFRAMNVVMKRDISEDEHFISEIPSNTYFDLSTPYGYGGFIYEGSLTEENFEQFNIDYVRYCKKNNIISEIVRLHPVLENAELNRKIYDVTDLGKTVTMKLESIDQIWDDLTSKNRNVIRKAIKSDVKVFWGRDEDLFQKFKPLYESTMNKDEATDYYYFDDNFYKSILDDLKYNMMFFYAVKENNVIAMAMILLANKQMHYHLSASNPEYNRYAPSNLMLNEAANWGVENGFESFHLGGGLGSTEDSLYKFKSSFNKNSNTSFSIGKKIFDDGIYNELVGIRKDGKPISENYFPLYRG